MDKQTQSSITRMLHAVRTLAAEAATLPRIEIQQRAAQAARQIEQLRGYLASWISVAEATEVTEYTEQYVRRLARDQRIRAKKVGRNWRVHRESLLAFYEQMQGLGNQRHNPWREDLAKQGRGRSPK
jgi:excisionase family DNA binding protein